jgi:hypothetical protein
MSSSITSSFPVFVDISGNIAPFSLGTSSVQNLKSSLKFDVICYVPTGYTIKSASMVVDTLQRSTNAYTQNITSFVRNGDPISVGTDPWRDVVYAFSNGERYKILIGVKIDHDDRTTLYQCVYEFNYLLPTPTLSDFTIVDDYIGYYAEDSYAQDVDIGERMRITNLTVEYPDPSDNPVDVTFSFDQMELLGTSGDINNEINMDYTPTMVYNSSGIYDLSANDLDYDNVYKITATASWSEGYSTSVNSVDYATDYVYVLKKPSIDEVIAYDAQNDGGSDGVGSDTSDQIIATISLNTVEYGKYKPTQIKFYFYDISNNPLGFYADTTPPVATTTRDYYDASGVQIPSHTILLNGITLTDSSKPLLNGVSYIVEAETIFTIVVESTSVPRSRFSNIKTAVFKQGVAPVLPLTIGNTWDLICAGDPSTTTLSASEYNLIPNLGISGHFKKNAQFGSGYSKNLDKTTTKFLLQYSIGESSTRTNVVKAALVQRAATGETLVDAIYRASTGAVVSSTDGDGKYANVVGPSDVLGSDQNELVFYIPGDDNGLNETNDVNIFVTIVDDANQWLDPSDNSIDNQSDAVSADTGKIMVNKIPIYSYTPAEASEPYINNVDVSNNLVSVLNNNVLSQVDESGIIADSAASMITQTANGWTVVNPAAVSGVVPKVNLYYYNQSMSSSTFTMGDINQDTALGMWYVIDQNEGANQYPFLVAYTKPDASGNAASWYKSKILYTPVASSDATQSGFTLLYTGTDNGSLYPEIPANRRVQLEVSAAYSNPSVPHSGLSTEEVNMVSIHTSSNASEINAGDFDFKLLYAGVIRVGSYTTTLFTDPLLNVNIPLDNEFSDYFDNAKVNNLNTPSGGYVITETEVDLSGNSTSSFVLPLLTQSKYTVQYSITNPNDGNDVVSGPLSAVIDISTLNTPQVNDFTVSNFDYSTLGGDYESSIVFDLSFNPYRLDRIDGVHVYFTSDAYSNIPSTRIGTFRTNEASRKIYLLSGPESNVLGSGSNPHDYEDALVNGDESMVWNPFTSATITFVPFRDNRVDSAIVETENLLATYTSSNVYNVPALPVPTGVSLTGGIVNSTSSTVLSWTNDSDYTYSLTMAKDSGSAISVAYTASGATASAILNIDTTTPSAYTLILKKVLDEDSSPGVTITFNSVKVDTSVMVVSVLSPDNLTNLTASWVDPAITGTDFSFADNIASLCLTDDGDRIDTSGDAPDIETSIGNYIINTTTYPVGSVLQLSMKVTAYVKYFVDSVESTSSDVPVPLGVSTSYTVTEIAIPSGVSLTGGIVNSTSSTVLSWTNDSEYTYTLTMAQDASANSVAYTVSGATASATLDIDTDAPSAYTLTLKKVFMADDSQVVTITFNSVKVDTSVMVVSVLSPDNLTNLTASWVDPAITGTDSSFADNVASLCLTDDGDRIDTSGGAPAIETSIGNYIINTATYPVNSVLQLSMKVTAYVKYLVDSVESTSSAVPVPLGVSTSYTIKEIAIPTGVLLTGGIVNSTTNTVLSWTNDSDYTYSLTMAKDSGSADSVEYSVSGATASAILEIAAITNNAYTLILKKVFMADDSPAVTVTFDSVKVDTSVMVVSVLNPSNLTNIKASWVAPTITGTDSSFADNVASLYLTDDGDRINTSGGAPTIETSGGNYTISNAMGYVFQLSMKVTAYVKYFVDSVESTSSAVPLPLGNSTEYTVSTVPNVALSSATSTVLISGTTTPSLLLDLNAKGLEAEGFISLVIVLTQDGTADKPEGGEVLLQFPLSPTSSNPFLFPNETGGAGSGNDNLVGAESSTVAPLNLSPTGLSNNVGNYTLTIGSVNVSGDNVGRYSLSSLTFPASSGFVNGQQANIMAILSSRRGTDVTVGEFTFATPPVASAVSVSTSGGNYYINFTLN